MKTGTMFISRGKGNFTVAYLKGVFEETYKLLPYGTQTWYAVRGAESHITTNFDDYEQLQPYWPSEEQMCSSIDANDSITTILSLLTLATQDVASEYTYNNQPKMACALWRAYASLNALTAVLNVLQN